MKAADYIIVGAGIIGLSIAHELKKREPHCHIIIFEKEDQIGKHASGRNSGVLHSGIYYPENTLKAKVCAEGAKLLAKYCQEYSLPIHHIGKVIVPIKTDDNLQLETLYQRALNNGVQVELVDEQQLKEIEPVVHSATGKALFSPSTSVIDAKAVLLHLAGELKSAGVEFIFSSKVERFNTQQNTLLVNNEKFSFGHLFNAAGLHADRIAKMFGIAEDYTILPFKGIYYCLDPNSGIKINHLVYPVPDLNVPFLGVHFTKTISNDVMVGPTAIPAFGRENYKGFNAINAFEAVNISFNLLKQYLQNKQRFRQFAHNEALRVFKRKFIQAAQCLIPAVKETHLLNSDKIGIRAQLLNLKTRELVMDFLVENTKNSTHILNAVSPAFTSSFSFAKLVVDEVISK